MFHILRGLSTKSTQILFASKLGSYYGDAQQKGRCRAGIVESRKRACGAINYLTTREVRPNSFLVSKISVVLRFITNYGKYIVLTL